MEEQVKIKKFIPSRKSFSNTETFKDFHLMYPEHSNVKINDLVKIINEFNLKIVDTIIKTRHGVSLPNGLGNIFLAACDKPNTLIQYKNVNGESIKINESLESDELLLKIFYSNSGNGYKISNHQLWGFEASRILKRSASKEFKNDFRKYIRVNKNLKLKAQLDEFLYKDRLNKFKDKENLNNKGFGI